MYHDSELSSAPDMTSAKNDAMADVLTQAQPVVLFLKEEIKHSSELLHKLAQAFNVEINILSETSHLDMVETGVFRLTEALQGEDRIQQRLADIIAALEILEKTLNSAHNTDGDPLTISILRQLKLDEMQNALAITANINDPALIPHSTRTPSLGDVDLF